MALFTFSTIADTGADEDNCLLNNKPNDRLSLSQAGSDIDGLFDNNSITKKRRGRSKRGRGRGRSCFSEGNMYLSAGYGWPNIFKTVFNTYNMYDAFSIKGIGPIHVKAEYGVAEKFGIGLSLGYMDFDVSYNFDSYKEGFKCSIIGILPRFNYHFVNKENLDIYTGLGAGLYLFNWKFYSDNPNAMEQTVAIPGGFGFEGSIGLRYFISPNAGIYTELGYTLSFVSGGFVLKF